MAKVSFAKGGTSIYADHVIRHPDDTKRIVRMSFNDLAKKEAADKRASLEKETKTPRKTADPHPLKPKPVDPSEE